MSQQTCTLSVKVDFDDSQTDPESLASAMDTLMKTALSTPGILDEYGDPRSVGSWSASTKIRQTSGVKIRSAPVATGSMR